MIPPQHSITAPIRYVSRAAFDYDVINAEMAAMQDASQHPWAIYVRGESRFDLDAPYLVGDGRKCVREYLKPDHGFPIWTLRRLRPTDAAKCRDAGGKTGQLMAFALVAGEKPMRDADVDAAADTHGLDEIYAIGEAALLASEAPKASEKKA